MRLSKALLPLTVGLTRFRVRCIDITPVLLTVLHAGEEAVPGGLAVQGSPCFIPLSGSVLPSS